MGFFLFVCRLFVCFIDENTVIFTRKEGRKQIYFSLSLVAFQSVYSFSFDSSFWLTYQLGEEARKRLGLILQCSWDGVLPRRFGRSL